MELMTEPNSTAFKMKPLDFEKDDDSNHHIDYITATSNLRARMYAIEEQERLKIKVLSFPLNLRLLPVKSFLRSLQRLPPYQEWSFWR